MGKNRWGEGKKMRTNFIMSLICFIVAIIGGVVGVFRGDALLVALSAYIFSVGLFFDMILLREDLKSLEVRK